MQTKTRSILVVGALACVSSTFAALKYDVGDYIQDGLVVHLEGIRNVGAGLPHDATADMWANLANMNNPAKITKNNSSGWRNGVGYYFCWNSSASYAQLAAGEYEVAGSYTFTAGAATDRNGKVHPIEGYTIETWNGSAWSAPVKCSSASYTYTVGTDPAKVRLMWQWQPDGTKIILQ